MAQVNPYNATLHYWALATEDHNIHKLKSDQFQSLGEGGGMILRWS